MNTIQEMQRKRWRGKRKNHDGKWNRLYKKKKDSRKEGGPKKPEKKKKGKATEPKQLKVPPTKKYNL